MIFSKHNIYNKALKSVATNIFIQSQSLEISEDEKALLIDFIYTVAADVDKGSHDKFSLLFPYEYREWIADIDSDILKKIHFKTTLEDAQMADKSAKLAVNIQMPADVKNLSPNIKTLLINQEDVTGIIALIMELNETYSLVVQDVNDHEELGRAQTVGLQYFEGDFIEKPQKVNQAKIPANKISVLNLIATLNDPEAELDDISRVITADNILSYKLLRIVNSPIFRGLNELTSIQEAIVRFGFGNLKKWVLMLSLCNISDKPKALVKIALQRAIMCSTLAQNESHENYEVFYTAGLLSTLDAFVDHPMENLLQDTALADNIKQAILNFEGEIGELLQRVIAYQRGESSLKDKEMTQIYIESAKEAKEIFSVLGMD